MGSAPKRRKKQEPTTTQQPAPPEDEARRRSREAEADDVKIDEERIDEAGKESFPASDPPAWSPARI